MRASVLCAAVAIGVACSSNGPPGPTTRTVDLGGGVTATLSSDGALVVQARGDRVLGTRAGVPLFSRALDDASPDGWHDPSHLETVTLAPIADAAITFEKAQDGVLHLAAASDALPAVLVSLGLASDDAAFYTGLGERFDHVSARGQVVPMQLQVDASSESGTNEHHVPVPLLVGCRAGHSFGVFVASHESGAFDVGKTDAGVVRATFEGKSLDTYVYIASDPIGVIEAFTKQVGLPRPLPRWALGPMLWRNEWTSDTELLGDAAELRKRHIPTTTMWVDNPWEVSYNDFTIDTKRFVDPAGMMQKLAAQGFRVVAWNTPYLEHPHGAPIDPAQMSFAGAEANGYFVKLKDGTTLIAPGLDEKQGFGMIDFTSDAARSSWTSQVSLAVGAGFSGFKLDYGEDLVPNLFGARLGVVFADGQTDRTARTYPLGYHRAYHDALDAHGGGILIVRASSFGGETVADIVWPGDLESDFSRAGDPTPSGTRSVGGIPSSVIAAQTLASSGFPAFGADTGGFRGVPTKEALLRWAEQTSLSLILQLGGGGTSHDPWMIDENAATIYGALATLHMRLEPYLSALMLAAETRGTPTVRSLPLVFPDDVDAWAHVDDEYLLGPSLLVAPVITEGASARSVYLPAGTWVGFWDGVEHAGPATFDVQAPLGQPPLFVRASAVVPMLAPGLDTLEPSTDPGTVSATVSNEVDALAWPFGSDPLDARWDDGATLTVSATPQGYALAFQPGAHATTLVASIDVRHAPTGFTKGAFVGGAPLTSYADEVALRAAPGAGFAVNGNTLLVRLVGAVTAALQ